MLIGTIKSVSYFPQTPIEQSEDMKYIHHSLAYKVLAKKKKWPSHKQTEKQGKRESICHLQLYLEQREKSRALKNSIFIDSFNLLQ